MSVLSPIAANAAADAVTQLLNGGYLCIYHGKTKLAELRYSGTAFGPASAGIAKANEILPELAALAFGTADSFTSLMADRETVICTGTVGTKDAMLILDKLDIQPNEEVHIVSHTYEQKM